MDSPTPDGYLKIWHETALRAGGAMEVIRFADILHYHPADVGLVIERENTRTILPWGNILQVEVTFNSPEYQAKKEARDKEVHAKHMDGEPQSECYLCVLGETSAQTQIFIHNPPGSM